MASIPAFAAIVSDKETGEYALLACLGDEKTFDNEVFPELKKVARAAAIEDDDMLEFYHSMRKVSCTITFDANEEKPA